MQRLPQMTSATSNLRKGSKPAVSPEGLNAVQ